MSNLSQSTIDTCGSLESKCEKYCEEVNEGEEIILSQLYTIIKTSCQKNLDKSYF